MACTEHTLREKAGVPQRTGPIVLCILDGYGIHQATQNPFGDCVGQVKPKFVDEIVENAKKNNLHCELGAHGPAVGLPSDGDMGNSEVGHNAMGCGQIYDQGAKLVSKSLDDESLFKGEGWTKYVQPKIDQGKRLHLFGLLSDGNVHSNIKHCEQLIEGAVKRGAKTIFVHPLLDGRDVAPDSGLIYIARLEEFLKRIREANPGVDARIASGGGRMVCVMDRYESDWSIVQRGFMHIVHGIVEEKYIGGYDHDDPAATELAERTGGYRGYYTSAKEAIEDARKYFPKALDQFNPPFVIVEERNEATCPHALGFNGVNCESKECIPELKKEPALDGKYVPIGRVRDDVVINFNFRGDRALQISRAMDTPITATFDKIVRDAPTRKAPEFTYVGMLEYDSDAKIPTHYLLPPPPIKNVMLDYLLNIKGMGGREFKVLQIAETHKYGHVTYFFNGNRASALREDKDQESRVKVESYPPELPLETVPEMKAAEVGQQVTDAILSEKYDLIVVNFANPDMVGHTGCMDAVRKAVKACDAAVFKIYNALKEKKGVLLLTADHGNAEEMLEGGKNPDGTWRNFGEPGVIIKTSHTLNPVDFSITDFSNTGKYHVVGGARCLDDKDFQKKGVAGRVGIANIAATIMNLFGYEAPEFYERSLIAFD